MFLSHSTTYLGNGREKTGVIGYLGNGREKTGVIGYLGNGREKTGVIGYSAASLFCNGVKKHWALLILPTNNFPQ